MSKTPEYESRKESALLPPAVRREHLFNFESNGLTAGVGSFLITRWWCAHQKGNLSSQPGVSNIGSPIDLPLHSFDSSTHSRSPAALFLAD